MIKLLILTIFYLFFGASPAFAVVTVTISNAPSDITDQPFSFDVSITGASAATNYLRADFFQPNNQTYFGYTYNGTDWYNGSTYTQYLPVTITSSGYNGTVQAKIDTASSKFIGNGTYNLRIRRYTQSGYYTANESNIVPLSVNIPTSSPSPSPSPSPSLSPTPSPTSLSPTSSSSFAISNIPSQISSDQSFTVLISLSLFSSPNTTFYLKGAFKKADGSNYFGLTKVGSNWVKNSSTYTNQYKITTNSSGNWSGNLEIKPDANDSGFIGSGEYLFKVARYEGSNLTWSNESNIQITAVENTDQGDISLDSSSSTTAPLSSPQPEQAAKSKTASSQSKSYDRLVYHTASVAAATTSATPSVTTEVKSQKQVNYFNWAGGLMILSGIAVLTFVYLRGSNLRETIFNLFRKRN